MKEATKITIKEIEKELALVKSSKKKLTRKRRLFEKRLKGFENLPSYEDWEAAQDLVQSIISSDKLIAKKLPPQRWIAKELLPIGISILSGSPGQYKTFLLMRMAIDAASHQPVFGEFPCEYKKKGVFFINEEMDEKIVQDRLKLLQCPPDIPLHFLNLYGCKLTSQLNFIITYCKMKNIGLVIFDSLTRIHNFAENDANEIKKMFDLLLSFKKNNIAVLLTHHNRKSNAFTSQKMMGEEMRGSVDIWAQLDCLLAISKVDNDLGYIDIKRAKMRTCKPLPDIQLSINHTPNSIDFSIGCYLSEADKVANRQNELKNSIMNTICSQEKSMKFIDIMEKLKGQEGVGERIIRSLLPQMEKDGLIAAEFAPDNKTKLYHKKVEINDLF